MSDATDMTDAIPAATLVVLRERASGPPDVLMVERAPAMAFAAGAMVFPGGRLSIIFPTQRNLERLARFDSYDAVAAHARATPMRVVTPWSEWRDGEEYLCIPDDLGYPITAQRMADMRRG